MSTPIIETPLDAGQNGCPVAQAWHQWLSTPLGGYLKSWEQSELDTAVMDVFGYHAVQLDTPEIAGLAANRMPHRWRIHSCAERMAETPEPSWTPCDLVADGASLPFEAGSLDLVVMPHTLELCQDPHATLREVERVLVPEGHVVITGINPVSLWGWHQRRSMLYQRLGWGERRGAVVGDLIGYWRLRDWLRLLGFEVQVSRFGCWRPAVQSSRWLARFAWLDRWGARWWPILGGAYVVVAVKRVPGGRMLGRAWKKGPAPVSVAIPAAQRQQASPSHSDVMGPTQATGKK